MRLSSVNSIDDIKSALPPGMIWDEQEMNGKTYTAGRMKIDRFGTVVWIYLRPLSFTYELVIRSTDEDAPEEFKVKTEKPLEEMKKYFNISIPKTASYINKKSYLRRIAAYQLENHHKLYSIARRVAGSIIISSSLDPIVKVMVDDLKKEGLIPIYDDNSHIIKFDYGRTGDGEALYDVTIKVLGTSYLAMFKAKLQNEKTKIYEILDEKKFPILNDPALEFNKWVRTNRSKWSNEAERKLARIDPDAIALEDFQLREHFAPSPYTSTDLEVDPRTPEETVPPPSRRKK